jgi:hypothetical protein
MFIAARKSPRPEFGNNWSANDSCIAAEAPHQIKSLYERLAAGRMNASLRQDASNYLRLQISSQSALGGDLPNSPDELEDWMRESSVRATAAYANYLEERKSGAPRRYFTNRAHALYFLRAVAPTKLVDGAWLYGLLAHHRNPRLSDLVRTYVEELGEGVADKNHVVLYRQLLTRYGMDDMGRLPDSFYVQGLIQLALACNAGDFLPEIIGFNLGYEQLPLHLLITAYELNELGIDPYYFTLHVTVDNPDTGHAKRAVQAVLDNLPRIGDVGDFWRRVRAGFELSHAGIGSCEVIDDFDIEHEVIRIFSQKGGAGHGAHSDYCLVGGRNVNDWLAKPEDIPAFLWALRSAGWIKQGQPVGESRFWQLLQGTRAEMFGVFSSYELQVIHDWIRGVGASADGLAFSDEVTQSELRRPSFRVAARLAAARRLRPEESSAKPDLLDSDLQTLTTQLPLLSGDEQTALLLQAMSPSQHWTPAGLLATQLFCQRTLRR